jgi:hypothetical protein
VGDIDFEVISTFENSYKFQKTKFWKEKSVENVDGFTLGPTAQATLAYTKKTLEIYQNDGFENIYMYLHHISSPNDLRTYIVFINHIKKQNLFGHH